MKPDLLSQLRTYGDRVRSEMTPLEVDHVGDPLVVLRPQPPKPSRQKILALAVAAAVLLILLPILVLRDQRPILSVAPPRTVLLPTGQKPPTAQLILSVPVGWSGVGDWAVINGSEPPDWMAVGFWSVANIFTDRCQWIGTLLDPPVGPAVDDLAAALAEHWGTDATTPIDVMVDGFAGKQMVLTVPTDVDFADCNGGHFQSWIDDGGGYRWFQGPGQIEELWILDVDGVRLVIDAAYFPETSPKGQAELQRIIDSIQIETE